MAALAGGEAELGRQLPSGAGGAGGSTTARLKQLMEQVSQAIRR